jgi:hypothetical protein
MYKLEKFIYNIVKNNQKVKYVIVGLYQRIMIVFRLFSKNYVNPEVEMHPSYFGGFHDLSLESPCGRYVAAIKLKGPLIDQSEVDIAILELKTKIWSIISTSSAFSWQMGVKLHWTDDMTLCFLDFVDDEQVTVLYNLETKTRLVKPYPVVHCHKNLAVSYDFGRVEKLMPGYGCGASESSMNIELSIYNIISNSKWTLSMDTLLRRFPIQETDKVEHFFHHSLFSKDGQYLFFLHRYVDRSSRRHSRMFILRTSDKQIKLIRSFNEMVSHITWISDRELIAYARDASGLDGYYILDVINDNIVARLFDDFVSDGHPTHIGNGYFISDTYPDRMRNQYLKIISREYESKIYCNKLAISSRGKYQIDLHPRFGEKSGNIYFDTYDNGTVSFNVLTRGVYESFMGNREL